MQAFRHSVLLLQLVQLSHGEMSPHIARPLGLRPLRTSPSGSNSTLYAVELSQDSLEDYGGYPPFVVDLRGTHQQIGFDYASLLYNETILTYTALMDSLYPNATEQKLLNQFLDYLFNSFLEPHTDQRFLDELAGMQSAPVPPNAAGSSLSVPDVARRFYTVANLPADSINIIAMLENELEPSSWPIWLRVSINELIRLLAKFGHHCDAFGVWGSRTKDRALYTSRNLDWNKDTGINKFKLVSIFHAEGAPVYATMGFASGLGALAGISAAGLTVSEMNLDNNRVTFSGLAFPLRLRKVLEDSSDLASARAVWKATNNTNSFNFLIGSAADAATPGADGANALETIRGYTAFYGSNSKVERRALYKCKASAEETTQEDKKDSKDEKPSGGDRDVVGGPCPWTDQEGIVHIGQPLTEAVFRSNHAFDPDIMLTQEPLFNNTMIRYNLMHDLIAAASPEAPIDDVAAVKIVSTLGTKGKDYFTCDQKLDGDNVMSIVYVPQTSGSSKTSSFYVAWEALAGAHWRPAACSPYVFIDLAWFV